MYLNLFYTMNQTISYYNSFKLNTKLIIKYYYILIYVNIQFVCNEEIYLYYLNTIHCRTFMQWPSRCWRVPTRYQLSCRLEKN